MIKLPWLRFTLLGCFVLLLTACGQAGVLALTDETQSPPAASLPASDTQMTQPTSSSGVETLIEKAREDLAQHLSIEVTQISLVKVEEVTWPDASLGCPKRGVLYVQAFTDGYLILFEVNGTLYEYHADRGEQVILCENLESPIFPVKPGEIDDGQPWMPN